jgi:hypothetical protein
MAAAKKATKLTGKAIAPAVPAASVMETSEFPDALSYINSLATSREGVEWDCRVYKIENAGRGVTEKQPFLFNVQLEDLPTLESVLADQFPGGGSFRVQVRADNQLVKNIKLDIAARPGYKPPPPAYLAAVHATPADPPAGDRMEMFFSRLAEMQERSARETRELIASIAAAKPAAPSILDQIQLFTQIQALMPKGAQESTMAMFEKGMDFATKLFDARGGEGGGASWLDIVKEMLASPLIKDALAAMAVAAQQPVNAQPAAPPSLISPNNHVAANAIDTLVRQAAAGVDPKMVAQQVANSMPAALMDELEQQEDVVSFLIARFPQIQPYRAWFNALVAEIWEDEQNPPPSHTMANPNAGQSPAEQP